MGILSGVASLFGVAQAASSDNKNRKFTQQENQKNRDWQEKMWNAQNEYNSPQSQISRLQAAGLNPALAYGSITDGAASSVAAPSTSSNYNSSQLPAALQAFSQQVSQLEVNRSIINRNNAAAEKDYKDAGYTSRQSKLFDATFDDQVRSAQLANSKVSTQIEQLRQEIDVMTPAKLSAISAQIQQLTSDALYKDEATRLLQYNAETGRISANAAHISASSQAYLAPFMASELVARAKLHGAQAKLATAQLTVAYWTGIELKSRGELNEKNIEKIDAELDNLKKYGSKDPGGSYASAATAFIAQARRDLYNLLGIDTEGYSPFTFSFADPSKSEFVFGEGPRLPKIKFNADKPGGSRNKGSKSVKR